MSKKIFVLGLVLVFGGSLLLRSDFEGLVESWLPGDEAGLASGILLGGSGKLSTGLKTAYRRVGMLHVVAASGYNVTIIGGVAMAVAVKLVSKRWAILFVVLSIILYMYLAGMTASVVRAGIMAILTYAALLLGRPADGYWVLGIVTGLMLVIRPSYAEDLGFLLSVAATVGVLQANPVILNVVKDPASSGFFAMLRMTFFGDLKTTLWAQLFTTPIILHYFGDLSLIAPVSNALMLWIVPIAMQILLLALGMGVVWPFVGELISYLAYPFLRLMNLGAEFFSQLPLASISVGKMSWVWVGAYYVLLIVILSLRRRIQASLDPSLRSG
ncbi:MAG: ComEC/Rec2 family competence protein [Patescibacteria group bacterium]